MYIYILTHEYKTGTKLQFVERKFIGIFKTKRTVKYLVEQLINVDGFKEFQKKCFSVLKKSILFKNTHNVANIKYLYMLDIWHEEFDENKWAYDVIDYEDFFVTEQDASDMEQHLKRTISENIEGIMTNIWRVKIGKVEWNEGFFDASKTS